MLAFREEGRIFDLRVHSYAVQHPETELASKGITLRLPEKQCGEVIWVTVIHYPRDMMNVGLMFEVSSGGSAT